MAIPFATSPRASASSPFQAQIPDSKLDEFRQLLRLSPVGQDTYESLQSDRKYGITTAWLRDAKEQWLSFNWRKVEDEINSFPNFKAKIQDNGIDWDIHYAALFSKRRDAVPVLMLHGWPGSFLEFLPILQLIKDKYSPDTLPYHIIVPSLPGYAFSSAPPLDRDFRLEDACRILDSLMVQLGFGDGYAVQGGDVGSKLARVLGGTQPRAKIIHVNFCIMPKPANLPADTEYNALEKQGLERAKWFERLGSAYAIEHATKPSTIALALAASPLSLLAWVGEKFLDWTDEDPPLETILASASLYWLTECFSTSLWPYRQLFTPGNIGAHENPEWYIHKPLGFSWFPKEISPVPRAWAATTGDLIFWRQHEKGGHFAAVEQPKVLLDDLESFIAQVWKTV